MKVGVVQLCSGLNPEHNLQKIRDYLTEAKKVGASAVFLPEAFYSISDGLTPTPYLVEEVNVHYEAIKQLALESGVAILGGSAATKVGHHILNRIYNVLPTGEELDSYDKIHLFACDLSRDPSKQVLDEGRIYTAGDEPKLIQFEGWKIGLSICFDLRFPELFRYYFEQGAEILSVSSAFTYVTGSAHWHTLLRARAIENQSYVIASNQWGQHNPRMKTFGHSLVIDPWGQILVDGGEGEGIFFADIDKDHLQEIRSRMNVKTKLHHL